MNIDPRKVQLSEKDIEDWLWENPQELQLFVGGRSVEKWIGRQVRLPSGTADLIGIYRASLVVVEVKNVELTADALTQVYRYAHDLEQMQGVWSRDRLLSGDWEYDEFSFFAVEKVVVFRGGVSEKLLHEANALGVGLYSFDVTFDLSISGAWRWTREKRDRIGEQIERIAHSGSFDEVRDRALAIFSEAAKPQDGEQRKNAEHDGEQ